MPGRTGDSDRRHAASLPIVIRAWPSAGGTPWRAYAEYRVFCRLSAMATEITAVHVAVCRGRDGMTRCAVMARLEDGTRIRARRERREPTGAIDAAVDEVSLLTSRRLRARRAALSPRGRTASSSARG